jgi:hypothetical protein
MLTWLLSVFLMIDGHLRPRCFLFYFMSFHLPPPNDSETLPPHVPPRSRALPNILPYRCRQLWVDCCVSSSNGGHLRPRPHLSLYFLMGCVLVPQTGEPTAAPPNPMACTFHGTIGSGGAMIWWRRWPNHGGRGLKPLEGRAAAAHFGCCVLCVLCLWLCAPFSYHTGRKSISAKAKWPTFAHSHQKMHHLTTQ